MHFYLIGLGSNIAPDTHLPAALAELSQLCELVASSPVLTTAAVGTTFHGDFANQLAVIRCALPAPMLKHQLLRIESKLGREPKTPERKLHDRTIDLDILATAASAEEARQYALQDSYYRDIQTLWNQEIKV